MKKIKIIAEIGWNHMGNMDLAEQMIESASESGADICKFQTWSVSKLMPGPWDDDGRREVYKKAELSRDQHHKLKKICDKNNVQFLTSIFNIDDVEFLKSLSSDLIKIPSHEIGNFNLISSTLKHFDQIIISTGASKWNEIENIINNLDVRKTILMHCVSSYPCPAGNVNIKRMLELKKYSTIGYSGHLHGINDALSAICLGAKFVEKHFTIDPKLPGRDNKFAIIPKQLKDLCEFRDDFIKMNVDHGLDLQECEMDTYNKYRGRWSNG